MKKFILLFALAAAFLACQKTEPPVVQENPLQLILPTTKANNDSALEATYWVKNEAVLVYFGEAESYEHCAGVELLWFADGQAHKCEAYINEGEVYRCSGVTSCPYYYDSSTGALSYEFGPGKLQMVEAANGDPAGVGIDGHMFCTNEVHTDGEYSLVTFSITVPGWDEQTGIPVF